MPLYECRCEDCGEVRTYMRPVIDREKTPKCASCDGECRKITTGGHFSLKGGGWFKDGYVKK